MCREYARGLCQRVESECKFAHPLCADAVRSDDGQYLIACIDALVGTCAQRQLGTCRYYHPPPHLLAQVVHVYDERVVAALQVAYSHQ